ncbi:hypothetical protein PINS_up004607 [Pythium insidiosum]|nr:hypothetical protein PINS_up004607 [Pythium insidiosum]
MADAPARRTLCSRCGRPPVVCYCSALPTPPLRLTRTRVVVLQHTREQRQRQSISSVPVLANAFEDASLRVLPVDVDGRRDDSAPQQHATIRALQEQLFQVQQQQQISSLDAEAPSILVLFPTADAQPLTPRPQREPRDDQAAATTLLVAIDGTWTEAKKIVHHLEALWTSLDVQFVTLATAPSSGSIYGELRREPMDGCVSTLEAVAEALAVLEPEDVVGRDVRATLRHAFQAMVDAQDSFRRRGRAAQEARYGGPKPDASQSVRPTGAEAAAAVVARPPSSQGVVKPYVFYVTRTDVCHRQELVPWVCDVCVSVCVDRRVD